MELSLVLFSASRFRACISLSIYRLHSAAIMFNTHMLNFAYHVFTYVFQLKKTKRYKNFLHALNCVYVCHGCIIRLNVSCYFYTIAHFMQLLYANSKWTMPISIYSRYGNLCICIYHHFVISLGKQDTAFKLTKWNDEQKKNNSEKRKRKQQTISKEKHTTNSNSSSSINSIGSNNIQPNNQRKATVSKIHSGISVYACFKVLSVAYKNKSIVVVSKQQRQIKSKKQWREKRRERQTNKNKHAFHVG